MKIRFSNYSIPVIIIWSSLLLTSCGVDSSGGVSSPPQEGSNSATLSWEAPTTNLDGTPLIDLAGFKVYSGKEAGSYTEEIDVGISSCQEMENKTACSLTIENLEPGKHFFTVTAYDTSGNESQYADEVSKTIN